MKIIDEQGIDEETGLISPIRSTTLLSKGMSYLKVFLLRRVNKEKRIIFFIKKVEKVEIEPQNQYIPEEATRSSNKPASRLPKVSGLTGEYRRRKKKRIYSRFQFFSRLSFFLCI